MPHNGGAPSSYVRFRRRPWKGMQWSRSRAPWWGAVSRVFSLAVQAALAN